MTLDIESSPYALDCFLRAFPENRDTMDVDTYDASEPFDTESEACARAEVLLKAGRFKAIILYRNSGDEWQELGCFPE